MWTIQERRPKVRAKCETPNADGRGVGMDRRYFGNREECCATPRRRQRTGGPASAQSAPRARCREVRPNWAGWLAMVQLGTVAAAEGSRRKKSPYIGCRAPAPLGLGQDTQPIYDVPRAGGVPSREFGIVVGGRCTPCAIFGAWSCVADCGRDLDDTRYIAGQCSKLDCRASSGKIRIAARLLCRSKLRLDLGAGYKQRGEFLRRVLWLSGVQCVETPGSPGAWPVDRQPYCKSR